MNLSKHSIELILFFKKHKNILLKDTKHNNKTDKILSGL